MNIACHPAKELADIRSEIKRLKALEKSLCAESFSRPSMSDDQADNAMVERQLRQVFRQNRLVARVGL